MINLRKYPPLSSVTVVWLIIFTLIFVFSLVGITESVERNAAESMDILERSVRRAAVQCYAVEGFYPSELDYLVENYGLNIGDGRYIVHYSAFASNLLPDIRVIKA